MEVKEISTAVLTKVLETMIVVIVRTSALYVVSRAVLTQLHVRTIQNNLIICYLLLIAELRTILNLCLKHCPLQVSLCVCFCNLLIKRKNIKWPKLFRSNNFVIFLCIIYKPLKCYFISPVLKLLHIQWSIIFYMKMNKL